MKNFDKLRKGTMQGIIDIMVDANSKFEKWCSNHSVCDESKTCKECRAKWLERWLFTDSEKIKQEVNPNG